MHRLTTFFLAVALLAATFASPAMQHRGVAAAALEVPEITLGHLLAAPPGLEEETPDTGCKRSASGTSATPRSEAPLELVLVLEMQPTAGQLLDTSALVGIRSVLQRRLELLGVNGSVLRRSDGRILVHVEDADDPERIASALAGTMLVEIIDPQGRGLQPGTLITTTLGASGTAAAATPVSPSGGDNPAFETIVSGRDFTEVYATTSTYTGAEIIGFKVDDVAAARLRDYTSTHKGQPMSIVLDKRVISSPYINDVISSEGVIEGFPAEEIPVLVAQLKAGALAVPLNLVQCYIRPTQG